MLKPHDLRHSVALECLTNITHLEERGDARQAVGHARMGSRNTGMFLEPGPETLNNNNLVAPTGFEPVFQSRPRFRQFDPLVASLQSRNKGTRPKHAARSSLKITMSLVQIGNQVRQGATVQAVAPFVSPVAPGVTDGRFWDVVWLVNSPPVRAATPATPGGRRHSSN